MEVKEEQRQKIGQYEEVTEVKEETGGTGEEDSPKQQQQVVDTNQQLQESQVREEETTVNSSVKSNSPRESGPEEVKDVIPDFKTMIFRNGEEPPRDLVLKYSLLVPAEYRQAWIDMHVWF